MSDDSLSDEDNRIVELEYKGRLLVGDCRTVVGYSVTSVDRLVLTIDGTAIGMLLDGPTLKTDHETLTDYLEALGLRIAGVHAQFDSDVDPIDVTAVVPDDVGTDLDEERADMAKIRRKWIRNQITTTVTCTPESFELPVEDETA